MHDALLEIRSQLIKAWRWRWIGIIVCWLIAFSGTVFVILMPDQYESKASILVDVDSALTPLTKNLAVQTNVSDQVRMMKDTLLTLPNMATVARAVDMDLQITDEAEEQELLEALRDRITVRARNRKLFDISYLDTDPVRARDVVQTLLTIFAESNLGENREDMDTAQSFFESQITQYEAQLTAAETKKARFVSENMGILSDKISFGDRIRDARSAIREIDYKMAEAGGVRDQLATNLAKTPKYNTLESAPPVLINGQLVSSTYGQIQGERKNLDDLMVQYTENHPDVIASQKRLTLLIDRYEREQTGKQDTGEDNFVNTSKIPNPVHEQLSMKLVDINQSISVLEQRRNTAVEVLAGLETNAERAPAIESAYRSMNRDYEIIKSNYEAMLVGRETTRVSKDKSAWTDTVQFKTIEPPQVPALPSGPPRLIFLGMVLMFSFGAGGGAAFLRSQLEDSFAIPSKLNEAFGLPVIGSISQISGLADKAKTAIGNTTFAAAAAAPVVLIFVVVIFLPYLSGIRNAINQNLLSGIM
jgi:polysaccharide chain length determinant protein (PEP-CTERM system associated)